ncbi:hypothetical protein ACFY9R_29085 [Streptomyces albidoflavus]|uniref:hypothetical protein n=1 Tax=Streptomyces albidoflavus TaxID=1886 RepID=UPI0033DC5E43
MLTTTTYADWLVNHLQDAADGERNAPRPGFTDAYGLCLTCGGNGSLMVGEQEIPYAELSPRRKQGHNLGHRFYRTTHTDCPDCDGRDRVTDAAVSAHEASL